MDYTKPADYLSESHKIQERVSEKVINLIIAIVIGFVGYMVFGYFLRDRLISEEDKRALKLIKEYRRQVRGHHPEYLRKLKEAEDKIKSKYPVVVTPFQIYSLYRSPASMLYKGIATVYLLFPLFATAGAGLYLKRVYESAGKEVFYQEHTLEKELYRKDPDYPYFTDTSVVNWEEMVDVKKVLELYAYVGNLKAEEYEKLRSAVYLAKDLAMIYAHHTVPKTAQDKKFMAILYFLLWHYGICLYGNVPVGYLSRFIKDEDLKTALALYQRRRVNTTGEQLARKVLMVLSYCHRDNGLYKIFEEIDPLKAK